MSALHEEARAALERGERPKAVVGQFAPRFHRAGQLAAFRELLADYDYDQTPASEHLLEFLLERGVHAEPTSSRDREGPRSVLTPLSDYAPREVRWLWEGRVPRGKLTGLCGDPGQGKSSVTLALAAALSRGAPLPLDPRPREPETTFLLSAEDDPADTIRPRLEAVGANPEKVKIFGLEDFEGREVVCDFSRQAHLRMLEHDVEVHRPAFVVIDPLTAFLGSIDSYRDAEVRGLLAPLADLAQRTGTAFLLVRHLRKSSSSQPLYRPGGSIGFTAAFRSELLVGSGPNDTSKRAVAQIKNNLSPLSKAVGFRIDDGRLEWTDDTDLRPADLLAPATDRDTRRLRSFAKDWLGGELEDGPRPAAELLTDADTMGISKSTLLRAKDELDVESQRVGGLGSEGQWIWRAPDLSSKT